MEVLFTTKVKRSKEPYSQQPWSNSIHEMSWFMPLPPWIVDRSVSCSCRNSYGDWREESGDESKNNSITWTKRKRSTWFPCWERKPVQDVSVILLTFQLRIVWHIFLTKSPAKADTLITAVKTGRLLEVEVHPNFRTLMEDEAFLSSWCRTFMHKGENVFSWTSYRFFFHQLHVRNHSMWCLWELPWVLRVKMMLRKERLPLQTHASTHSWRWWHCTCAIVAITIIPVFDLAFLPVSWQCRHQAPLVSAEPIGGRTTLLNTLSASRTTVMGLWLSPDSVYLEFDEEIMKPAREAPDHAGFNPDTMKVSNGTNGRLSTFTSETSHLSVVQVTLLLKQTGRQKESLFRMMNK